MYNCHAETSYCTPHGNYTLFIIHYKINSSSDLVSNGLNYRANRMQSSLLELLRCSR